MLVGRSFALVLLLIVVGIVLVSSHPTKPVERAKLARFYAPNALDNSETCTLCNEFVQFIQDSGNNETEWIPLIEKICSTFPQFEVSFGNS